MKVLIVGISGVTCSGKTTLTLELQKLFPNSRVIFQDYYFYDEADPRHVWCDDVAHINYDILTSLDMAKMHTDILAIIGDKEILCKKSETQQTSPDTRSRSEICASIRKKIDNTNVQLVFLDGFLLYNYEPIVNLIYLKYFFTLEEQECAERRSKRTYEPPDIPGYFEKCVWPMYLKHLGEIENSVKGVVYFNRDYESVMNVVLSDIDNSI